MNDVGLALRTVVCGNDRCPSWLRMGKRKKVGEASPGSIVSFFCPSCRQSNVYRVV